MASCLSSSASICCCSLAVAVAVSAATGVDGEVVSGACIVSCGSGQTSSVSRNLGTLTAAAATTAGKASLQTLREERREK